MSSEPTTASEGYLAEMLDNARDALIAKGLYLGVPNVLSQVVWHRFDKAHYLSTPEEVNNAAALNAKNPGERNQPSYAVLSVVVLITSEDYWLTSDRMWRGPECGIPFAQIKPTCTGRVPTHPTFSEDFKTVLENLDKLVDAALTQGVDLVKGPMVTSRTGYERKLKFRHVLFEVQSYYPLRLVLIE
jgi:hypothetical protein